MRATHSPERHRFDKAYYDRYYRNPRTRAVTPAATRRQAEFIAAYLRHLDIPIRRILDLGCGTGGLLRALGRLFPRAALQGVDVSEYLSARYGWTKGSVIDHRPDRPADLVVCNDVLGYLDDAGAEAAIANLTGCAAAALYLGVLTTEDLTLCDRARTDPRQIPRPAAWYRQRLAGGFLSVGGGLHLKQPVDVTVWHLERG